MNSSTVSDRVSNAAWEFDGINGGGVGTTGQFANHANATGGLTGGLALTQNPAFELTIMAELAITTPEPAGLAILGAGLAGLGLVRRRKAMGPNPVAVAVTHCERPLNFLGMTWSHRAYDG